MSNHFTTSDFRIDLKLTAREIVAQIMASLEFGFYEAAKFSSLIEAAGQSTYGKADGQKAIWTKGRKRGRAQIGRVLTSDQQARNLSKAINFRPVTNFMSNVHNFQEIGQIVDPTFQPALAQIQSNAFLRGSADHGIVIAKGTTDPRVVYFYQRKCV